MHDEQPAEGYSIFLFCPKIRNHIYSYVPSEEVPDAIFTYFPRLNFTSIALNSYKYIAWRL